MVKIEIIKGDITKLNVDAIVNAANSSLLGGGGVDGAIHNAAGKELLEECKLLNGCETGQAKITKAYNLDAKYVIHTVGPIWRGETANESNLLKSCYTESLSLAIKHKLKSIAFPNISTGIYGFPKKMAGEIARNAILDFTAKNKKIAEIYLCIFDEENYRIYKQLF